MAGVLVTLVVQNSTALAWGDLGHETVAEIAQSRLTPQATAWVESLLGPEKLSIAAIFPDQVRDDHRYKNFASYHLCDVVAGTDVGALPVVTADPRNCLAVFNRAPAILLDPKVSIAVKRIALRYLIHVVGDTHQPLHVGNGLDLGANLCNVNVQKGSGSQSMNLHGYWDTTVVEGLKDRLRGRSKKWFGSTELAAAILAEYGSLVTPTQISALQSSTPEQWVAESSHLRRHRSYPDAEFVADEKQRPYCKFLLKDARGVGIMHDEFYDPTKIPLITYDLQKKHQALVEEQLFKGGVRLANLLNTWAPTALSSVEADPIGEVFRLMSNPNVQPFSLPPEL